MFLAEVRPQNLRDVELRVADLPEQGSCSLRNLPGRADQQIGVGDTRGVERSADGGFVDTLGRELTGRHAPGDGPTASHQLVARAVI